MNFKLNPAIQAVKGTDKAFDVMYTLVNTNGVRYVQEKVEITDVYKGEWRGTEAKVILKEIGGIATIFEGNFELPEGSVFGEKDTYLSVNIFTENNGVLKRDGGSLMDDQDTMDE